ncbi:hypothetical protein HYW46_06325 [Candidatus Daviesbacteria bacterium]|nr:hypothetical protein [Candidatus Daviesbacteria bacterium]
MHILKKIFLVVFSTLILGAVIYFVEPPNSWENASIFQILVFFIPLLFFFSSIFNVFIISFPKSFVLGLGLMFITVLWAIGRISITSVVITAIATILLFTSLPKSRFTRPSKGLTSASKASTLSKFRRLKL